MKGWLKRSFGGKRGEQEVDKVEVKEKQEEDVEVKEEDEEERKMR